MLTASPTPTAKTRACVLLRKLAADAAVCVGLTDVPSVSTTRSRGATEMFRMPLAVLNTTASMVPSPRAVLVPPPGLIIPVSVC